MKIPSTADSPSTSPYSSPSSSNSPITKQPCAVCGKLCRFKFYNVQSCESCKQFFRRAIVSQKEFFCSTYEGICDYIETKCRSCRLDRCLQRGMLPSLVKMERTEYSRQFLQKMEQRQIALKQMRKLEMERQKKEIMEVEMESCADDEGQICVVEKQENMIIKKKEKLNIAGGTILIRPIGCNLDWESFSYFCHLISAQKRLWNGFFDIPDEYFERFSRIEDVLEGPDNILALDGFLDNPIKTKMYSSVEAIRICDEHARNENANSIQTRIIRGQGIFLLIVVGFMKAMPAFKQLSFEDKVILIGEIYQPFSMLLRIYYSAFNGAKAICGPSGVSWMTIISAKYKDEIRIVNMAEKIFIRPLDAFRRLPSIGDGEFSLLLAIFCSNPGISGLSEPARLLLEAEQSRYCRLLLHYFQMRLGEQMGAKRFADCVQLISDAFHISHKFDLMQTYMDVFHSNKYFYAGLYPEYLKILTKKIN